MRIAVFDFDGTLTSKDTFLEFIKFSRGIGRLLIGLIWLSPVILSYKMGIMNNGKAKERVFRYFFKGMALGDFNKICGGFSDGIDKIIQTDALKALRSHQESGDIVIIISASVENWIEPWASMNGVSNVIATKIDIDDNSRLTGKFLTNNCYGQEKVNRLMSAYPERSKYILTVYGDSKGDLHLMEIADERFFRKFE